MIKHYTSTGVLVTKTEPRKVLLGLHQKLHMWLPPGGHQEENENPLEGLVREVKEETGFDVTPYLPKLTMLDERVTALPVPDYLFEEPIPSRGDKAEHIHMDFVYLIEVPLFDPVFPKTEYSDMRWIGKNELIALPTYPNIREVILPKILE
jgi:8-oxo-dGTP diphosphatase